MRKPPSELLPDDDDGNDHPNPNQSEPSRELGFKIQIRQQHYVKADNNNNNKIINEEEAAASIEVYIRWIWGLDNALFESFYGMLRKNIFSCNFNHE